MTDTDITSQKTTHQIRVGLGTDSYDILIGSRLLQSEQAHQAVERLVSGRKIVIITDHHVGEHHLKATRSLFTDYAAELHVITIEAGESSKSFACFEKCCEDILSLSVDRQAVLVALGGGVVGDLAGYVAASLLRGLDFIQIPTSLLAQVDSSVGGKTGINSQNGKNLVGAFHQPKLVLADISVLATLDERQMKAGYAEIVKYGLLGDLGFFEWLEQHGQKLLSGDEERIAEAVMRSCQAKADIVAADEREKGNRALLNLGHTFAHAFEAVAGYDGRLLHGEAVSAGLVCAFEFSHFSGLTSGQECSRVRAHLEGCGLIASPHQMPAGWADPQTLIGHMAKDKKAKSGRLTFILVHKIGQAFIQNDVSEQDITAFLERI